MCCCGSRMCMLCTCVIVLVILIGFLFGFGVFKNGFHKLKDTVDFCDPTVHGSLCSTTAGRPFFSYPAAAAAAPPPL